MRLAERSTFLKIECKKPKVMRERAQIIKFKK